MTAAPAKDAIQQRHLGLPPQLLSTSLLTWHGIEEIAEALQLAPGDLLVDLACGRGGYGLDWPLGPGPGSWASTSPRQPWRRLGPWRKRAHRR